MVDLAKLTVLNGQRAHGMWVLQPWFPLVEHVATRLIASRERYQSVSAKTGIPWAVIAVIHEREASQSWVANLAQGDPWNAPSVHIPKGRGPFDSWESAAVDALTTCPPKAVLWRDWTFAGALTLLEQYNGLGYAARGVPSPYLWCATNQYACGKYVADGHYDPHAIDHQIGCAALLARMAAQDPTVHFEPPISEPVQ